MMYIVVFFFGGGSDVTNQARLVCLFNLIFIKRIIHPGSSIINNSS